MFQPIGLKPARTPGSALRGGGGNFGVVTRFSFRLHQVGPTITGGLIVWSAERAAEVLAAYRDLTEQAPRELTAAVTVRLAPPAPFLPQEWHGKPIAGMILATAAPMPRPTWRRCGPWTTRSSTWSPQTLPRHAVDAERHGAQGATPPLEDRVPSPAVQRVPGRLLHSALQVTSPLPQSLVFHLAGALNDHEDDDGAVGNRDARYIGGFAGTGHPPPPPTRMWPGCGSHGSGSSPFSTGGNYVDFQLADDDAARTADAYGNNYQRLQQVKATYDLDNLFRVNRNLPPAA